MAANKNKISEKNLVAILAIAFVVLVLISFNANTKLVSVIETSESISNSIVSLNSKMTEMGQKTLVAISEISKQRAELEDIRKKLTQERLKNVQLQGTVEEMSSKAQSAPIMEEMAPETPVSSNSVN